jgi:hypothetical protein
MQLPLAIDRDDRSAVISPCGLYRYRLGRRWGDGPPVMFLMLNPSKADAVDDDATLRRCVDYARRWGFPALVVGNLFAFRATDPADMKRASDPVGPENDQHLIEMASSARLIVAAWGNHGAYLDRDKAVRRLIRRLPGSGRRPPKVLGLTQAGQPVHPLRQRVDLEPIGWEA